jgi:hypothetical protein
MPKIEVDYSRTIIYKICCKDPTIEEIYVGHTTNFTKRKYQHKIACNNSKDTSKICKIINDNYETIKLLRGNSANLKYVYYTLRKTNKLNEYIKYFPTDKFEFYEEELNVLIKQLHTCYIECFIKKINTLKTYDFPLKHHLYQLHNIYLSELRSEKKYVNKKIVSEYIYSMPPAELLSFVQNNLTI